MKKKKGQTMMLNWGTLKYATLQQCPRHAHNNNNVKQTDKL